MKYEPLTLKTCLQLLLLTIVKANHPMTAAECYEALNEQFPPPPQPGKPNRKYSKPKIIEQLRELCQSDEMVEVPGVNVHYYITNKGLAELNNRRIEMYNAITSIHLSLQNVVAMIQDKNPPNPGVTVLEHQRSFLRSLLSLKDVVRTFILKELMKKPKQSMKDLHSSMIQKLGWSCSLSAFIIIGRNEMTEGVGSDNLVLETPVIFLKSEYQGKVNRRKMRVFSIDNQELVYEWLPIYSRDALSSTKKSLEFTTMLIKLLRQEGV
ncbi:hypothetical protein M3202_15530 [Alkalihalobacillus oceani]|uniref:Uncharacterized protein n=1 Tax=Halalkalibacter oceani TaxID=1653776 RepID=A0A9X2DTY4_9BACI|nr:hypothetical protein [Halalkalibacter oceani]MCM3715480.1 hypothetical protein [Halalkalibacter oceani]